MRGSAITNNSLQNCYGIPVAHSVIHFSNPVPRRKHFYLLSSKETNQQSLEKFLGINFLRSLFIREDVGRDILYLSLQGNLGLSKAIEYFTSNGIRVSIPLNDTQKYDLVADIDNKLYRISVKTTRYISYGHFVVQLRNTGGARVGSVRKVPFDNTSCDYLFVYCSNEKIFLVPSKNILSKNILTITDEVASLYEVHIKSFKSFIEDL